MDIKELREKAGLSQSQFADYLHINIRTLQSWEQRKRTLPEYVTELIEYKLKQEGLIGKKDTNTVYVVTEGEDSDYHIEAIFSNYSTAERFCACNEMEYSHIEEWKIDDEDIQSKEEVLLQWCFEVDQNGKFGYCSSPTYVYKSHAINYIDKYLSKYKILLALDPSITKEEAQEIAADRLAIYKAKYEI